MASAIGRDFSVRALTHDRLIDWHSVVLVAAVREEPERYHPMIVVLDTNWFDVDAVKMALRLWWWRIFT